jgi:hypothetical protein
MDRIRKALDRARVDRGVALAAELLQVEPVAAPVEAAPMPEAAKLAPLGLPVKITYTSTKSFDPDADTLEKNRVLEPAAAVPAAHFDCCARRYCKEWRSTVGGRSRC